MSIIEVKNLGKKYKIGKRQIYVALRDMLMNIFRSPWNWFKHKTQSSFGGSETSDDFWALKDVNFNVEKGEILGIIGRNGAGKSTLLKILSQITPPTTGEIRIRGRVGSLLEVGTGFHQELSGRENIYLNGAILGMSKKEIDQKFNQIVEFADIGKFLDVPVKRYSSGMQVRLAFSVAAHLEPEILIIDEVLAVGDTEFQKKCLGKMEEVTKKDGRTVIFVSHNMGAVRALCTRCVLLDGGRVHSIGSPDKIIGDYVSINLPASTVEISEKQHIRGDGNALITKASIINHSNRMINSFLVNEKISFSVDYFVKDDTNNYSFWLIFYDNEGMPLVSSFQKDTGILVKPKLGNNHINIEIADPGLTPGRYTVSMGIFNHEGPFCTDYADWVDNCFVVDVNDEFINGRHFDSRLGKVDRQAKWITN